MIEEGGRCGNRVIAHQADVSDEAQVQEMFRRAVAEFGHPGGRQPRPASSQLDMFDKTG